MQVSGPVPLRRMGFQDGEVWYFPLVELERQGAVRLERLPYALRVLLENSVRAAGLGRGRANWQALADWRPGVSGAEMEFWPARVLLQDLTGVPLVVDLAALRSEVAERGGDPTRVNPVVPVDLVIDHSVQVDAFGTRAAFATNVEREYARNRERYMLLRWAQGAFSGLRVVPPGTGIVHQVNLEYLATVVARDRVDGRDVAFPDTLVGTDSHTTMINGLGVLGWGVGGIEAEAVMLGEPYGMTVPEVVGLRLTGRLPAGTTATDLVLRVTELLRAHGVVGKFVEFYGPGLTALPLADRATLSNMAPEYGATAGFFPVDHQTLAYLALTGRSPGQLDLVERYCRAQLLLHTEDAPDPEYSATLQLDLGSVEPSVAGPRRPQDRLTLAAVRSTLPRRSAATATGGPENGGPENGGGVAVAQRTTLADGAVAIAAITSCTNTSNPGVMVAAGLLARRARARGLTVPTYCKTSLAPGSRVVTDYLERAGLLADLEALGFAVVGYGCTTCIGNSGPLTAEAEQAARQDGVVLAAVLSGNRNFQGRINALVRANYLASPPLVVAYALAGTVDIDLESDPLGRDPEGQPVYLRDIWPDAEEVAACVAAAVTADLFRRRYAEVFAGDALWRALPVPDGMLYRWDPESTYVRRPPFFAPDGSVGRPFRDARVLCLLGDSVTTDDISPAGEIVRESEAARYLTAHGVERPDFNTYGARRGNHEVMMRGTFANVRLRNQLVPDAEGPWTLVLPEGERASVFAAAQRYAERGTPLIAIAGQQYGSGSSRDWAAKGPYLLGVRAVIAQSFERIHRANLIGMGVLPLEFADGTSAQTLGLTGRERFAIQWDGELTPRKRLLVRAEAEDAGDITFPVVARLDTVSEVECLRRGGILPATLARVLAASAGSSAG